MMTQQRLQAEKTVLEQRLKPNTYQFVDMETLKPYLIVGAMTNSGHVYTLKIMLETFPYQVPRVCVMNELKDKNGKKLGKVSGPMHIIGKYDGHPLICHYGSFSWSPDVSLYKVFIKCRLWLEMYEEHLRSGKPIDYYLKHQS
jgi:hypothetical protein